MGVQKQWEGDDEDEDEAIVQPPPSNIPRPPAGNVIDPSSLHVVRPDFTSGPGAAWPQQQGQQTQSAPNPWQGARPLIPPVSWRPSGPTPPSGGPSRPSRPRVPPLPHIPQLQLRPQGLQGPPPPRFSGTSGQPVEWGAGPVEPIRPGYHTNVEDLPGGVDFNGYHFPGPRGHPRGGSGSAVRGAGAGRARRADRGGRDTGAGSGRGGRRQGSS